MRICGLLALIGLVIVTGGATIPAEGAFPGGNGLIAFTSHRDGNPEIYVMNADGSGQTRLTNTPAAEREAHWSPDGRRIAFASRRDGDFEIFVMNADGSGVTQLTNNDAIDDEPAWSPDGQKIAFVSNRVPANANDVYVMNADGSAQTNLTNRAGSGEQQPEWSPDGEHIAFNTNRDGNAEIYVMNADGSGPANVTNSPNSLDTDPSWSPDGQQIAFTSDRDRGGGFPGTVAIHVMNANGSAPTRLTTPGSDRDPAWSADGTRLAFGSGRDGNGEIYAMSADGSAQTRLTVGDPIDEEPNWQPLVSTAEIEVTGGPEPSELELKGNSTPAGLRYTFDDAAPLQIVDSRCDPPDEDGVIVCESPVEVAVEIDLGGGNDKVTLAGNRPFAQLTVNGGPGEDEIVASPRGIGGDDGDRIEAKNCGSGECLLEGGPGDDVLTGGTGNDRLRGGTGSDELVGDFGRDTADYSDFTDTVEVALDLTSVEPEPEQGRDTFPADDVEDLVGGSGTDELTGGALDNRIEGLGGDDFFFVFEEGVANTDELVGGSGDDMVTYQDVVADVTATIGGDGTIVGDPSRQMIGADVEAIEGGEGDDTLTGSDDDLEELIGGPGNDELVGEGGADVLDGEADTDLVTYAGPEPVSVDLSDEDPNDGHEGEGDKLLRVEDVAGGDGNDELIGSADPNQLFGEGGDDTLIGGEGVNLLDGGPGDDELVDDDVGSDSMLGGAGVDTADYSADLFGVVVDAEGGPVVPCDDGGRQHDCVADDVEEIDGGSGDDVLTGTAAANTLIGNDGNDTLKGLAGADLLVGGPADDDLFGGDGEDELLGGEDLDDLDGEAGNDLLEAGDGGGTLRGGDGDDELLGGDDDDDLLGGAGNDELTAGAGEDGLAGDAGNDTLDGGPGPDQPIDGGDGVDTLLYADRTRAVFVDPEPGGALASTDDGEIGEADQVLDTVENITGGAGDDGLLGTAAANTLVGNDGNDTLTGVDGPDVLEGGFGLDMLDSQDGVRDEDFCGPSFDTVFADPVDNVSVDCEQVTFPVSPPPPPPPLSVNTPPGTNVVVQPSGGPVTLTFSSVTAPGQTTVVPSSTGPAVPSGFQLGNPPTFYEISTTAQFTPPVTVCLNTTGLTFPGGQPQLFHFENGAWRDVTTAVGPGPQVCGVVSSLSPFAAFAPKRAVKVVRCVVPNVRGKTLLAARKAIVRARCTVGRVRRTHSTKVRTGRVVSQAPRPGTRLRKGAKVTLVLSRGRKR